MNNPTMIDAILAWFKAIPARRMLKTHEKQAQAEAFAANPENNIKPSRKEVRARARQRDKDFTGGYLRGKSNDYKPGGDNPAGTKLLKKAFLGNLGLTKGRRS